MMFQCSLKHANTPPEQYRSAVGGEGGCTHAIHARSRMIIDFEYLCDDGTGKFGFLTYMAEFSCTRYDALWGVRRVERHTSCTLPGSGCEANILALDATTVETLGFRSVVWLV